MENHKTIKFVFTLLLVLSVSGVNAQQTVSGANAQQDIYYGPPNDAISTPNPQVSEVSELDLVRLDSYELFSLDRVHSIFKETPSEDAVSEGTVKIQLWVFQYDSQSPLHNIDSRYPMGLGELIFRVETINDQTDSDNYSYDADFNGDYEQGSRNDRNHNYNDDIQNPSHRHAYGLKNLPWTLQSYKDMASVFGTGGTPGYDIRTRSFYKWVKEAKKHKTSMPVHGTFVRRLSQESFPVVFYEKTENVIVDEVYFQGLVDNDWSQYFERYEPIDIPKGGKREDNNVKLTILVNSVVVKEIYPSYHPYDESIDIKMGDKVTFRLNSKSLPEHGPKIYGVPQTWIANLSGESKYYCSPSVTPGEFNPWLGYDSNVHGVAMRRYDQYPDFKINVDKWAGDSGEYSWSWVAQRRMSALKENYTPPHSWKKEKTSPVQRNNQKAGLNMELLRAFNGWSDHINNKLSSYTGPKYLLGLDPDEILYLNYPYSYKKTSGSRALLSVKDEKDPWKVVTKDETLPVINEIVTAYRKNRENYINKFVGHVKDYDGYEIMDRGTSATIPSGIGEGNVGAPGYVSIKLGSDLFKMKFNVTAPLVDKGFYQVVQGTGYPAQGGKAKYSIGGLIGNSNLDGFSLEYMNVNGIGKVTRKTFYLKDESSSVREKVRTTGKWTNEFKISKSRGYNTVTAYYQRTPNSKRVIIGGKELLEIQLRFFGVKEFNEGKGDGGKIYKNEFRNKYDNTFNVLRGDKYTKPYVRQYIIDKNKKYTFSILDSDPHTFNQGGTEWYLSERLQAKKIPKDSLNLFLKYSYNTVAGVNNNRRYTDIGTGENFSYTWNDTNSNLSSQIISVTYNPGDNENDINPIEAGSLSILSHKLSLPNNASYKSNIGEILLEPLPSSDFRSVYGSVFFRIFLDSEYAYLTGPRAKHDKGTGEANRFSKYNDLKINLTWTATLKERGKDKAIGEIHHGIIGSEDFLTLEGYKENFINWFPSSWVRHYNGGIPSDVPKNDLKRVGGDFSEGKDVLDGLFEEDKRIGGDSYEAWQHRFDWIAITPYQGPRVRTNFKAVYHMPAFFDNTTGAFSGNPTLPKETPLILPSDKEQYTEDNYRDVVNGTVGFFDYHMPIVKGNGKEFYYEILVKDNEGTIVASHDFLGNLVIDKKREAPEEHIRNEVEVDKWFNKIHSKRGENVFDYIIAPNPIVNSLDIIVHAPEDGYFFVMEADFIMAIGGDRGKNPNYFWNIFRDIDTPRVLRGLNKISIPLPFPNYMPRGVYLLHALFRPDDYDAYNRERNIPPKKFIYNGN